MLANKNEIEKKKRFVSPCDCNYFSRTFSNIESFFFVQLAFSMTFNMTYPLQ